MKKLSTILHEFKRDFSSPPYAESLDVRAAEMERAAMAAGYIEDCAERNEVIKLAKSLSFQFSFNTRVQNAFTLTLAFQRGAACEA